MAVARLSIPNTLKESTMIRDANRDNPRWKSSNGLLNSGAPFRSERDCGNIKPDTNNYEGTFKSMGTPM